MWMGEKRLQQIIERALREVIPPELDGRVPVSITTEMALAYSRDHDFEDRRIDAIANSIGNSYPAEGHMKMIRLVAYLLTRNADLSREVLMEADRLRARIANLEKRCGS